MEKFKPVKEQTKGTLSLASFNEASSGAPEGASVVWEEENIRQITCGRYGHVEEHGVCVLCYAKVRR